MNKFIIHFLQRCAIRLFDLRHKKEAVSFETASLETSDKVLTVIDYTVGLAGVSLLAGAAGASGAAGAAGAC